MECFNTSTCFKLTTTRTCYMQTKHCYRRYIISINFPSYRMILTNSFNKLLAIRPTLIASLTRCKITLSQADSLAMASNSTHPTVSYVTAPNETIARQLSKKLVEQRLAACVNIVKGVESIYEWQGKIEQDSEFLLIIKSCSHKSELLANFIRDNHPYECPELVTVKVESGSKPYLDWIYSTTNKEPLIGS